MEKEKIFKGEWFLPDNEDNKVSGILTYKPYSEFSELELFGSFESYTGLSNFDIVLGKTFEGEIITLHKAKVVHYTGMGFANKQNTNRVHFSRLKIQFIFSGFHIKNVEDLVFNTIETEIYNLENWVGLEGFSDVKVDYSDENSELYDFDYKQPKSIKFSIRDNLEGAINFSMSHSNFTTFQKEYKFTQTTTYSLVSTDLVSFHQLLYDVYIFQNFLVSAIFIHTNPFNILLKSEKLFKTYNNGYDEIDLPVTIQLYSRHNKKIEREKPKSAFEMLFTYDDIEIQFPEIIKKWYEKYNTLINSFGLFFYQFYISDRYLDVLFLNLSQAAESFHFHLNPDKKILSDDEFKKRKAILKASLPKESYDWINKQLGNKLYLGLRLDELTKNYCNDALLNYIDNIELFKRNIRNTRNYLTHFDPELKDKALHGSELYDLYTKLRMLLISAFLIEAGFEKVTVSDFFKKNGSQVFSVNLNTEN